MGKESIYRLTEEQEHSPQVIFENSALYEPAYFLKPGQLIRYTRIEQDKHCDLVRIIKL